MISGSDLKDLTWQEASIFSNWISKSDLTISSLVWSRPRSLARRAAAAVLSRWEAEGSERVMSWEPSMTEAMASSVASLASLTASSQYCARGWLAHLEAFFPVAPVSAE